MKGRESLLVFGLAALAVFIAVPMLALLIDGTWALFTGHHFLQGQR